jgi:chorismate synthase
MSSTYGKNIKVSVFGQSHSAAIGVNIDGLPAGERIDTEELMRFMSRRAPGNAAYSTKRREPDVPEILCGVVDSVTCGAPLCAVIRNTDQHSSDYNNILETPRPAHADYTAEVRYGGHQDVRGGGHFSGRLTAPLCIAGGICLQILRRRGITVAAHISSIAGIKDTSFDPVSFDDITAKRLEDKTFPTLDDDAGAKMRDAIEAARLKADSVGGVIECAVSGMPAGVGAPMFDGMENRIAAALFAVPAVKGVEFGAGFAAAEMRGSENNDPFTVEDGRVRTVTNNHGGILGGITSGMPIVLRAAFKPTPSIGTEQQSINVKTLTPQRLTVRGRHDPCVVVRAVPVVEAVCAIAVLDALMDAEASTHQG